MARDPRGRPTDDGAQPVQQETPSGLVPEEAAEPIQKRTSADPDWLTMATADPAFFLKEPGSP
jgi:hypothetical protein